MFTGSLAPVQPIHPPTRCGVTVVAVEGLFRVEDMNTAKVWDAIASF